MVIFKSDRISTLPCLYSAGSLQVVEIVANNITPWKLSGERHTTESYVFLEIFFLSPILIVMVYGAIS